jgi:hypothetical protein
MKFVSINLVEVSQPHTCNLLLSPVASHFAARWVLSQDLPQGLAASRYRPDISSIAPKVKVVQNQRINLARQIADR